ncbi:hypothetical protein NKR23_g1676 [Pleurostoma richardsiae]|uniref:Uncharacterized protein n=1 Tax=Pleurostoma richardsiae TaxID=41990 RepID=A0AA38SC74_9PEZI|nr:hypothetical protein NKR23_g1676 [Pleurostoma richardsiae]
MDSSKDQKPQTTQQPQQQPGDGSQDSGLLGNIKSKFAAHTANPGPVVPDKFNIQQEGTKEERRAKAEALNK